MLYCEKCERMHPPAKAAVCPSCGEGLRYTNDNDAVLLLSVPSMQADTFVEPLLKDSGIPYVKKGELGVGFTMRAGNLLEMYHFYVPYSAYPEAHDLIASTYGEDSTIMEGLI